MAILASTVPQVASRFERLKREVVERELDPSPQIEQVVRAYADLTLASEVDGSRLRKAIAGALPDDLLTPESDLSSGIDKRVSEYIARRLSELAREARGAFPATEPPLTEEIARLLLTGFHQKIKFDPSRPEKRILTSGEVAINLACLVHYGVRQPAGDATDLQRRFLLDACKVADLRPLPAFRWTEFVRANLSDPARLRATTNLLIYSVALLSARMSNALEQLRKKMSLSDGARLLVIGSSATVFEAIGHLANQGKLKVFVTHPTEGMPIDPQKIGFAPVKIEEAEIPEWHHDRKFEAVLVGCGVIGKTSENELEIVNWAPDVVLAKRVRAEHNIPLVAVGGLYKLWAQAFYERHKAAAVECARGKLSAEDAVLTQSDLDWFVTEHDAVNYGQRTTPHPLVDFLLETRSVEVPSTVVCLHKRKLIKGTTKDTLLQIDNDLCRIDAELHQLRSKTQGFLKYDSLIKPAMKLEQDLFRRDSPPDCDPLPTQSVIDALYDQLSARFSAQRIDTGIDNAVSSLHDRLEEASRPEEIIKAILREATSPASPRATEENRTAVKALYHALEGTDQIKYRSVCAYLIGSMAEKLGQLGTAESYYLGALDEALAHPNKKIAEFSAAKLARLCDMPEFLPTQQRGEAPRAAGAEREGLK